MNKETAAEELLTVDFHLVLPYRWAAGPYLSRFFREIRDNKRLLANRCGHCRRILLPPRVVCGQCRAPAGEDWVELSDKGTLRTFIKVVQPGWDPVEGRYRSEMYMVGEIELDGAEGALFDHFLEEQDPQNLLEGMRVQAVWREQRSGDLKDILHFKVIQE